MLAFVYSSCHVYCNKMRVSAFYGIQAKMGYFYWLVRDATDDASLDAQWEFTLKNYCSNAILQRKKNSIV